MHKLRELLRKTPGVKALARHLRAKKLQGRATQDVFTEISKDNKWRGIDSVSGRGSDNDQTAIITNALPLLMGEFGIRTILDIPCGDFHWMKNVDLGTVNYIGADIVSDLIATNSRFESQSVRFVHLDLIKDTLPMADLVFCRDCLVHLSFSDALKALQNICRSDAEFLLTTTFSDRGSNKDIVTGEWRPLNLEKEPFNFPSPLKLIEEGCTEGSGKFRDKSLGLWKVSTIKERLKGQE